jgi:hypothetical protein
MRNVMGAVVMSLSLVACGGESSTAEDGESGPLNLHGHVVAEEDYILPNAEVLLVWHDFSASGQGPSFLTTARGLVEAQSPRSFTLTVPGPPSDAVYWPDVERDWGVRYGTAKFILVEPGAQVRQLGDAGILASTHNYVLAYAQAEGEARIGAVDGGGGVTVPKGFSLVRQDTVRCADGYDQSCIDSKVALGSSLAWAKSGCGINPMAITHPVDVPTDTELVLTVRDPNAPPPEYTIPCPQ